ncbi:MAG: protein kinase [Selenomonadaceae bacterium]|nr:protein kinase [Selenomonadaceae bacterium]
MARGLSLLHRQGIIHRDIKPSNLLVEKDGTLRLIDFDAVRHVKEGAGEDITRLGTKGYAPPEQFGYGQTDARSDIYALGMTFKHLLPADYAGFLRPVLRKCTAMDPGDRYQSMGELAESVRRRQLLQKIRLPLAAVLCLGLPVLAVHFHTLGTTIPNENPPIEENLGETLQPVPGQETPGQSGPQTGANALPPSLAAESSPADAPLAPQQTTIQPQSPGIAAAPAAESTASPEVPRANTPLPSTESTPRGQTTSSLIWNGIPVGGDASLPLGITPAQWQSGTADLVISNGSNLPRESSSVKIVYSSNYGNKLTAQENLPYLEPGQSTRLSIPCGAVFPIEDASRRIWVQIYLERSNVPDQERYWCLQFEMAGEGK